MRSLLFHGHSLRVELRRFLFVLATLALFGTAGELVWNRATTAPYSPVNVSFFTPKPVSIMAPANENPASITAVSAGKVYANAAPGFVQTPNGQGVYDDRRVLDVKKTGPGATDGEVTYLDPSSATPTEMPLALFLSQIGEDVTDALPPVNEGDGQTGDGHNWRPWAGNGAAQKAAAPVMFSPGAGQVQPLADAVAASMPEGIKLPETRGEGAEKPVHITTAPVAPAAPAAAAPAPVAPAGKDANDAPAANNFANSDSDTPAVAAPDRLSDRSPSRVAGQSEAQNSADAANQSGTADEGSLKGRALNH